MLVDLGASLILLLGAVCLGEMLVRGKRGKLLVCVLHVETLEYVVDVRCLIEGDLAALVVLCDFHAQVPVQVPVVGKLVAAAEGLDELLVELIVVGAARPVIYVEANE